MQNGTYKTYEEYLHALKQLRFAESYDKVVILECTAGKDFKIKYLELN